VKILAFFAQTTASFCKKLIITLVFEKNAIFFAENWQKSQKNVIITSTPDLAYFRILGDCRKFFLENYSSGPFWEATLFHRNKFCMDFVKKMAWATFWAIFTQTHLVTLVQSVRENVKLQPIKRL
jgi:hypothetical protein